MKKYYLQPTWTVIKIQQMQMLCESVADIDTNLLGGDDVDFGGAGGDIPALAPEITDFMGEEF